MSYPQSMPTTPGPYGLPQRPEHPQGSTVFTLGILGIFLPGCCFFAWLMGNQALRDVNANPGFYGNADTIRTGRMLGLVMSWLCIASAAVAVLALVFMLFMFLITASTIAGSH